MQSDRTAFFSRDDTLFGVCQALGEDFGIPRLCFGSLSAACSSSTRWR